MARGKRASAKRRGDKAAAVTVGELTTALHSIAPFDLAEEWDNVGLLAGAPDWPVERVLVALDLTDAVAQEALRKQVDAVVLYHPPIFKPLTRITPDAPGPTRLLPELLAARSALLATHTALDAAPAGTNDQILDWFDVAARRPLQTAASRATEYKLVVFVPPAEVDAVRSALAEAGAGVIGNYSECSYELRGRGSFKGDDCTNPTIGERGKLEFVDETRLELVVPRGRVGAVVRRLYEVHSYEEPAFDLYPVEQLPARGAAGMGRIGDLRRKTRGAVLLKTLAQHADTAVAQLVGSMARSFARVVAAAGAFGVNQFTDEDALYITGEFKHHDALTLQRRGVTCIALGHHQSEAHVLDTLRTRLRAALPKLRIEAARSAIGPFRPWPV